MFARRYFPGTYFAPRYWPGGGALLRPRVPYTVVHDEAAEHKRSRQHEQQVADICNGLLRRGELLGPLNDPELGAVVSSNPDWGMNPPVTLQEALDRIAAALTALGHSP